jgi:serine protease Do
MDKKTKTIITFIFILLVATAVAAVIFVLPKMPVFMSDGRLKALEDKITILEKGVAALNVQVEGQSKKQTEIMNREIIKEKSQEDLLTAAVAEVVPSVVSVVVTKDVPKLEIVYINPFGDDPFFQDFGIRVPQYRQKGTEQKEVGAGTGFLVSQNGYILTNRHVVEDTEAYYTVLLSDGSQKPATVVWRDSQNDIAVVKIEGKGYHQIQFGDSDSLKLGQSVFAVGNALGEYNNSVSVGVISGLNRTIEAASPTGSEKLTGIVQTDAAINPGNSGGPLVDLEGKVVGINVAMVRGSESIGFAIPVNKVKDAIKEVIK